MKRCCSFFLVLSAFLLVSCQKDRISPDNYILESEVVFSRHNIRSPLSAPGSVLDSVTTHQWVDWGVEAAHLTARGGRIEQKLGGWFREDLSIFSSLDKENTLIYSNSKQRTIKTAENFLVCFNKNLPLYYRYDDDRMDPLFNPVYTVLTDDLQKKIIADMNKIGGVEGTEYDPYRGIVAAVGKLTGEIRYMEEIIDFEHSLYAQENHLKNLPLNDLGIILTKGAEPAMTGGYKLANSIADAVVLQYYETGKAFGEEITFDNIRRIGKVKTVYDEVLFANHTTAVLVSNPLVKKLKDELCDPKRRFTFLCGHDSNIASITAALGMKLPQTVNAVEFDTPIGSKIVFRKYRKGDSEFIKVNLVYASVSQLRETCPISVQDAPMILPIDFDGLSRNPEGFYRMEDVIKRFDDTIAEFNSLVR